MKILRSSLLSRPLRSLVPVCVASLTGLTSLNAAVTDPGFPVITRTPGDLLSNGFVDPDMGRLSSIAFHRGLLVTIPEGPGSSPGTHHKVQSWDISTPAKILNPVLVKDWGKPSAPYYTINASHHHLVSGNQLHAGWWIDTPNYGTAGALISSTGDLNWPAPLTTRAGLTLMWDCTQHTGYGTESDPYTLKKNNSNVASWNQIAESTVPGHTTILGDLLLVMGNNVSRGGVATWDISDPTSPRLLDVIKTDLGGRQIGGYWGYVYDHYALLPQRKHGSEQTDDAVLQVVDISDPENLRAVATIDAPLADGYVYAQDEFIFYGPYKIDSRTWDIVLTFDVEKLRAVEQAKGNTGYIHQNQWHSNYMLPLGNLVVSGGIASGEGFTIWAHQAEPDTRGPQITNHWPAAGRTDYPVGAPISVLVPETLRGESVVYGDTIQLRASGSGSLVDAWAAKADTGLLTIAPKNDLADDTIYEVVFTADGITDVSGNGLAEEYRFTFSTGSDVAENTPPSISAFGVDAYPIQPGSQVTLSASASDAETGVEYRFDTGDGGDSGWQSSNTFAYTYDDAGHYLASVRVRDLDTDPLSANRTTMLTVMDDPGATAPPSSAPLAMDAGRDRLWAVAPDNDVIARIDANSGNRGGITELPSGSDPRSLAVDNNGRVWVTAHDRDEVIVINRNGSIRSSINLPWGSRPRGIVIDNNAGRAYVACEGGGTVQVLDIGDESLIDRVATGGTPNALALSHDGSRLLVTNFISDDHAGMVWSIDTGDLSAITEIPLFRSQEADNGSNGRGLPNYLSAIAISPDGQRAWVTAKKDNVDRGLEVGQQDLAQDQAVRAMVAVIDLTTDTELIDERIDIDNTDSPVGLAFSPLGDYVFVTLQGNNSVVALDALAHRAGGGTDIAFNLDTGHTPQGALVHDNTLWTHDFLDRAVGRRDLGDFLAHGTPPAAPTQTSLVNGEALESDVLAGKRIFYNAGDERMSAEGYISCASCHRDGGHDGRTYDFTGRGEGLRNTITLRGRAGMAHGNVHWTANFDEIQDFENDIRGPFGGTGFMSDGDFNDTEEPLGDPKAGKSEELDQLAAYVTSLGTSTLPRSPDRRSDGSSGQAAIRGEAIFFAQDCATCHDPGQSYRDGLRHDVGTARSTSGAPAGDGIETPTLLGLHATAPYLHDGSAATIDDVFRVAAGTWFQAEDASGNGNKVNDTTNTFWHGDGYVELGNGERVRISDAVDASNAGTAVIEIRYATDGDAAPVTLSLDGQDHAFELPGMSVRASGDRSEWGLWRAEVPVGKGTHELIIEADAAVDLAIDAIHVAGPDEVALAAPHRTVLELSDDDRADLQAFLGRLDDQDNGGRTITLGIYRDGNLQSDLIEHEEGRAGRVESDGTVFDGLDDDGGNRFMMRALQLAW